MMRTHAVKSIRQHTLATLCFFSLVAYAGPSHVVLGQAKTEWDFDHQVQFKRTQFDKNHYQLEVISNKKGNFERLSAFLLRRSYLICGSYGYKLELITGVESFDYLRASPNYILPNLTAKLECATEK
jgi:hypothetical protein